ncbi:MAG: MBL fold metallo-hydrolase [Acidobacteriota bacterium]|nr:MAG: MBL fold metallo-hydrolase [Acidobacteriota bacterium]
MWTRIVLVLCGLTFSLSGCQSSSDPPPLRIIGKVPFDETRRHQTDFPVKDTWEQLSENLFLIRDTCNVYLIRQGDDAVLIDFGSGLALNVASELGINRISRVLVTHHHRDQVQGLLDLDPDREIEVVVPEKEAHLFAGVEQFWEGVRLYLNYDLRSHFNTIRQSIPIDRKVNGGDIIEWGQIPLRVFETPGQTEHSVSYSGSIDGRRVVFSGDLISAPGKVHNWFDLHWDYYGFTQGIEASETSFERIEREDPDLLLPSHGEPISTVSKAFDANRAVHRILREMLPPNELHRTIGEMRQITPHLVHLGGTTGQALGNLTSYAILSESGKALLYDYGYASLEQIELLKEKYGVSTIDVATFSHYHDDHLIRAHDLLRDQRTDFWVFQKMVDVLEHPERYRLPCLVPFPIRADRILKEGEVVRWEEYELEFFHLPGQTEFHQGLVTLIDGRKVMFAGDNTWNKADPDRSRNGPLVPQNEYFLDGGFITCAKKMLDYMPDIVCPAHTEEYYPTREDLNEFLDWAYRLRDTMTAFIDQPDPNFGMDYRWCHFYPYRTLETGNAEFQLELVIRNHLFKDADVAVALQVPADVTGAHLSRSFRVPAKTAVAVPFQLRRTLGDGRRIITADIVFNNKHLGEVAEAVLD